MFYQKNHTICIYNVKTKRNQQLIFLWSLPPPPLFRCFLKQQPYLYLFQPTNQQPTTPLLNRQAEEASTEAAGKQSQEALEEARAQRLKEWRRRFDDRRFPTTFFVCEKKNRCREISGMEKEIERNQSVVGWYFFPVGTNVDGIPLLMCSLPERNNRGETTPLIPEGA